MRGILVILAVLLIGLFGTIFFVGRINNRTSDSSPINVRMVDYVNKDNSSVSWTQRGRLLGDDLHKSVKITISPNTRKVEVLDGYNMAVSKTSEQPNNKQAYSDFLFALENMQFGFEKRTIQTEPRGVCPFGFQYFYELKEGSESKINLWSISCNSTQGTLAGQAQSIKQLFKNQITDYNKFVRGVKF